MQSRHIIVNKCTTILLLRATLNVTFFSVTLLLLAFMTSVCLGNLSSFCPLYRDPSSSSKNALKAYEIGCVAIVPLESIQNTAQHSPHRQIFFAISPLKLPLASPQTPSRLSLSPPTFHAGYALHILNAVAFAFCHCIPPLWL